MGSIRTIAKKMDPVMPPMSLRELIDMHRFSPSEERSLRNIYNRHHHSGKVERTFLFLNTFLMNLWLGGIEWRVPLALWTFGISEAAGLGSAKKPAVSHRAKQIGELVRDSFDIALLAEIFDDMVKNMVLSAWNNSSHKPFIEEDAQVTMNQSSGLVTISQKDPLSDKVFHQYNFAQGADALAEKGVLLTYLDVGFESSKLELYNTHLNTGSHINKRLQILELMTFIDRNYDAENNVAVVAGDFNIDYFSDEKYGSTIFNIIGGGGGFGDSPLDSDAIDPKFFGRVLNLIEGNIPPAFEGRNYQDGMTFYEILSELMYWIGFQDIWAIRNGTPGYTCNMEQKEIADQICHIDPVSDLFCDDIHVPVPDTFKNEAGHMRSNRIDYVFISNAIDTHKFSLDYTRPRRTRMARTSDAPAVDEIAFLSDHVGLATTLVIVPKQ